MIYIFRFGRLCVFRKKNKARENVVEAIQDIDWEKKTLSVRVNSMDTDFLNERY